MEKSENLYKNVYDNLIEKGYTMDDFVEVFESIISYKAEILNFTPPDPDDMLDMFEDEKIGLDAALLATYTDGATSTFFVAIASNVEPYENSLKLKYKDKTIYVGYDFPDCSLPEYDRLPFGITVFLETKNPKRYLIGTNEYDTPSYNPDNEIDKYIINYESKVQALDESEEEHFKVCMSDLLKNFGNVNPRGYYYPSNNFLESLLDIVKTYEIPFTLSLKDGYLTITSDFDFKEDYTLSNDFIYNLADLVDQIFSLIDLINEYE